MFKKILIFIVTIGFILTFCILNITFNQSEASQTIFETFYINGIAKKIGVYLPVRHGRVEQTLPVIFLSHGYGGNEKDWFEKGNLAEIMDKLIKAEKIIPTIIVTLDLSNYFSNSDFNGPFYNAKYNFIAHILPFVEEKFNVATEPYKRAKIGLSMGGSFTNSLLIDYEEYFKYYAIFSGGFDGLNITSELINQRNKVLFYGFGNDAPNTLMNNYRHSYEQLRQNEIEFIFYQLEGGHDYKTWSKLLEIFLKNYLWK